MRSIQAEWQCPNPAQPSRTGIWGMLKGSLAEQPWDAEPGVFPLLRCLRGLHRPPAPPGEPLPKSGMELEQGEAQALLFSPQTTEQTEQCDVLTNVLYFKFSTIIKDFVWTLRIFNFFLNLIDQSPTFNWFWRFWIDLLEFPPATSP